MPSSKKSGSVVGNHLVQNMELLQIHRQTQTQ